MQLHPRENFTIVRQLADHTDSGTYYVQAVVRNAKTDTLLATVDLVDRGDRRFSEAYLVPADVSGQGFWISILTSVYTDAGHTTKSENYGDEMETYLVQAREVFNPNYPIPVGPDIDYKRIKKMIDEAVAAMKPEELPEPKVITVTKEVVVKEPMEMKMPEMPKMPDMKPMMKMCEELMRRMDAMEMKLEEKHSESMDMQNKSGTALLNNLSETVKMIKSGLSEMQSKLDSFELKVPEIGVSLKTPEWKMADKPVMNSRITRLMKTR